MAQVMAHRQVVATKTKLSQKQSTETVQVMLYTSASMLCSMRGMFPSLAFDEAELADDELYTVEGLINGEHHSRAKASSPSNTSTRSSESTRLKVPLLKRGRSDRADQFIESLDTVFEALNRGTLHALRIPFMGDPEINPDPLEIWCFRILYIRSPEGKREVQGLQANYKGEDRLDPSLDLNGRVLNLLETISEQCRDSTQLPNECYIQPSIMYIDDGWQPNNFVEAEPEKNVKGFAGWQPHAADLGVSGGSKHEVSLRVAFLKHESSTKRRISQDLRVRDSKIGQASRIPTGTTTPPIVVPPIRSEIISPTGGRTTSSTSAIPETPQHVHGSKIGSTSLASSRALRSVASKSSSNTGDISQIAATPTVTQDEPSQSVASNASQVDDDMRRKSSLESMMKPRSNLDDNFLTQPRAIPSQISNAEDGLSLELTEHMKKYDFLSREKAQQLWYAIPELQQRARMLANGPITGCRCRLVDSTEDMVQCGVCGVQQHLICQGYLEVDNRQLPEHVCHICLLGREADHNTLKKLQVLALQRRAMDLLLSQEAENAAELGKKLGMEFDQVAELVASLVSQGFLVEEFGRRTRNSQGKIKFPESISTPEYIGLFVKLFDTYQVVGHHFSGLEVSDAPARDVTQTLKAKYSILTRPLVEATSVFSPEREKAATANTSKKTTTTTQSTTKKRARTTAAEGVATSVQSSPLRQPGRVRTPTPKMKEAKFGFFINAQNLPSRENPGIKSKRFKGDS
ncbi:hypothetical protein D6D18_03640 [Aureobasidium pullulans]|nr:hypothetical protein D6D18_03640 [Aureobasidium pullulans]